MEKQKRGRSDKLTKEVRKRAEVAHTRFSPGEPEIARLLLDRLPPDMITAAKVYLDVICSQELSPRPWSLDSEIPEHISEERAGLLISVKDLLYRSLWFADQHTISPDELRAIFRLSGIHDQHLINPIAKAIHEDRRNWSLPEKGYQDQVHQRYLGPGWVIDELDIHFSETDLRQLVYTMLHQTGELVEDRKESLKTRFRLSPSAKRKILAELL